MLRLCIAVTYYKTNIMIRTIHCKGSKVCRSVQQLISCTYMITSIRWWWYVCCVVFFFLFIFCRKENSMEWMLAARSSSGVSNIFSFPHAEYGDTWGRSGRRLWRTWGRMARGSSQSRTWNTHIHAYMSIYIYIIPVHSFIDTDFFQIFTWSFKQCVYLLKGRF